jgi:hypothetical protein
VLLLLLTNMSAGAAARFHLLWDRYQAENFLELVAEGMQLLAVPQKWNRQQN